MSDITISYKGNSIATMDATGTKTLLTEGKYCEDDITIDYTQPSGGGADWDGFVDGSWPTGDVVITTGTTIREQRFYALKNITSLSAPTVETIDNYAFAYCTNLAEATNLGELKTLGQFAFRNCNKLGWLYLPKCTTYKAGGYYFGYGGKAGYGVVVPAMTGTTPNDFTRASNYTIFDFGEGVTALGTRCFYDSNKTHTIILRNKSQVVTAADTNRLSMKTDSVVYVPSSLIASYQVETNWANMYASGVQFLAIEGSQYETHYADGTAIPTS